MLIFCRRNILQITYLLRLFQVFKTRLSFLIWSAQLTPLKSFASTAANPCRHRGQFVVHNLIKLPWNLLSFPSRHSCLDLMFTLRQSDTLSCIKYSELGTITPFPGEYQQARSKILSTSYPALSATHYQISAYTLTAWCISHFTLFNFVHPLDHSNLLLKLISQLDIIQALVLNQCLIIL